MSLKVFFKYFNYQGGDQYMPHKPEDLSSIPAPSQVWWHTHAHNSSAGDAESGGSQGPLDRQPSLSVQSSSQ